MNRKKTVMVNDMNIEKKEDQDISSDVKNKKFIWETWLSLVLLCMFLINEFAFLFFNVIVYERAIENIVLSLVFMVMGISFAFSGFRQGGEVNKAFSGLILLSFISVIALLSIH